MKEQIKEETAIFAGGCFWCTEAVFNRIEGVSEVVSGYTGGHIKNPAYREICTGRTGHAEGVRMTYNSEMVSYDQLLAVFFATHNPTTLNQQGADKGTQYRSAIFYSTQEQKEKAEAYIKSLDQARVYDQPIVTTVQEAMPFYTAENYHQEYYEYHKEQPYCQIIINPKLDKLNRNFNELLKQNQPIAS